MRTWSKRPARWMVIFGLLIAAMAAYTVYGQETGRPSGQMSGQPGMTGQAGTAGQPGMTGQAMQYSPKLVNANKVIGKSVQDNKGQKIGTVEDVVLDNNRQRVNFVVLSTGGVLGMGEKYFAVPWHAVSIPQGDGPVVLNASKDQVNGAPQFDKGHWPGSGDPLWRQSMQYWHQQMGMTGGMTGGRMGGREWKGGQSSGGSSSDSGSGGSAGAAAGGTAGQSGMGAGGTTGDQSGMGTAGTSGGQSGMGTGGTSGDQSAKGTGGTSGDQSGVGSAGTSGSPSGMAGKSGTYGDVNPSGDSSGMSNRGWSSEDQMGMEQGNPSPMKYRRLTQIIGLNVKDYRGDQIGEIENVMIDADHGVVAYGIIGHGGFLKIGEKITPVPWTAVQVNPQNEVARISTDRQTIDRLAISEDQLSQLSNPDFSNKLARDFGQEPYWVTYGYVSPEGGGAQGSFDAWRAGSAYNRNFQAGKIEHYTGTVEGVGTFTPERGSAEGLRLRVRTDQGQTITVHAGPWAYAQQQGFSSLYGQKITVTGARSTVNGRDVLMATKIEASGKTWELRDESGTPKWNVDQLQSQMGGKMGERYTGGRTGEQMTPGGSAKPGDQAAPGGSSDQGTGGSTGKTGNASPWSAG